MQDQAENLICEDDCGLVTGSIQYFANTNQNVLDYFRFVKDWFHEYSGHIK